MKITWEDVLGREDLVGGEILCVEGESIARGPIQSITDHTMTTRVGVEWCACRDIRDVEYRVNPRTTCVLITREVEPFDIGMGRILFPFPRRQGYAVISPRGWPRMIRARSRGFSFKRNGRILHVRPATSRASTAHSAKEARLVSIFLPPKQVLMSSTIMSLRAEGI